MVPTRLRHGADLLDSSRFGWDAVQLFGSSRKFSRGGNFERLLCRPPDSVRRRIETRYSARRRYGGQNLERGLARHRAENHAKTVSKRRGNAQAPLRLTGPPQPTSAERP